ncbi:MAG: copper chaperone PCu(A)C [Hyphomicrobium sp.]
MRRAVGAVLVTLGLLAAIPATAHEGSSKGVTVAHPWVRASPGGSTLTAAFLEIKAENADKLIGGSSPAAGRVEVHTHIMEGDVMKMRRVDTLDIKAGESRVLKPMGDHIMMLDLKAPLKEGDLVKLTLTFEKAGPIEVDATVEPVGAMGPHGMDHQPAAGDEKSGGEHQHH